MQIFESRVQRTISGPNKDEENKKRIACYIMSNAVTYTRHLVKQRTLLAGYVVRTEDGS